MNKRPSSDPEPYDLPDTPGLRVVVLVVWLGVVGLASWLLLPKAVFLQSIGDQDAAAGRLLVWYGLSLFAIAPAAMSGRRALAGRLCLASSGFAFALLVMILLDAYQSHEGPAVAGTLAGVVAVAAFLDRHLHRGQSTREIGLRLSMTVLGAVVGLAAWQVPGAVERQQEQSLRETILEIAERASSDPVGAHRVLSALAREQPRKRYEMGEAIRPLVGDERVGTALLAYDALGLVTERDELLQEFLEKTVDNSFEQRVAEIALLYVAYPEHMRSACPALDVLVTTRPEPGALATLEAAWRTLATTPAGAPSVEADKVPALRHALAGGELSCSQLARRLSLFDMNRLDAASLRFALAVRLFALWGDLLHHRKDTESTESTESAEDVVNHPLAQAIVAKQDVTTAVAQLPDAEVDRFGPLLLKLAVGTDHLGAVHALLSRDVDPNLCLMTSGHTCLTSARSGDVARALIIAGADVHAVAGSVGAMPAVFWAAAVGRTEVLLVLLEAGAMPSQEDRVSLAKTAELNGHEETAASIRKTLEADGR